MVVRLCRSEMSRKSKEAADYTNILADLALSLNIRYQHLDVGFRLMPPRHK